MGVGGKSPSTEGCLMKLAYLKHFSPTDPRQHDLCPKVTWA